MNDTDSFIHTDTYKTKDLLWENYTGFLFAYNNYISQTKYNRSDAVVKMTLEKYTISFYDLIKFYFKDFEKELTMKKIEKMMYFAKKEELEPSDYRFIRNFFGKFMHVSKISNVSLKKEDPREAVSIGFR